VVAAKPLGKVEMHDIEVVRPDFPHQVARAIA
jgi:hypothetical protein